MIEQPLKRGEDEALADYEPPLPFVAMNPACTWASWTRQPSRYQMINIKLDKCGGLTHGLMLAKAARDKGLGVMVGCMGGTSLAMAPSHVLAQVCDFVDIDGPLLLRNDRLGGFRVREGFCVNP